MSLFQKLHHLKYKDSKISLFCKTFLFCNVCMSINAVFVDLKKDEEKEKERKRNKKRKEPKEKNKE